VQIIYSLQGRPFQVSGDRLWDRSGGYVGKFVDDMVFGPDGAYRGELRGERLGFRRNHASRRRSSHMTRMNRMGTMRMNRMARMMPSGWDEFHG
jgi:hypothetical protein